MRRLALALFVLAATPAFAHEGRHDHLMFAQSVDHLLTQPDHQLAFAGLVVSIIAGGWVWARTSARR